MGNLDKIYDLITQAGPAALTALTLFMWWMERKEKNEIKRRQILLEDRLLSLSTAQTQAMVKFEAAVAGMRSLLFQIVNRFKG